MESRFHLCDSWKDFPFWFLSLFAIYVDCYHSSIWKATYNSSDRVLLPMMSSTKIHQYQVIKLLNLHNPSKTNKIFDSLQPLWKRSKFQIFSFWMLQYFNIKFCENRKFRTRSNIYRNSKNQFHAEFDVDVEIVLAPGDKLL